MSDPYKFLHSSESQQDVLDWLASYRNEIQCTVERIPFSHSAEWKFDEKRSSLRHRSGRFFSIDGFHWRRADGSLSMQPLINQPEVGTQGFVVSHEDGRWMLLAQARTEPGNIGIVQLGPTIQATYSNYTAVHQGKSQPFLDHFHRPQEHEARGILDTVQPELGSRFLHKWNRNVVIDCPAMTRFEDPMFRWVDLQTFAELMQRDHVVNNDARLVFGLLMLELGDQLYLNNSSPWADPVGASFTSLSSLSFSDFDAVKPWCHQQRSSGRPDVVLRSLQELPGWQVTDDEISRIDGREFSVIQVRVHADDREVTDWDQPLVAARNKARMVLFCKQDQDALNVLLQMKSQIGDERGPQLHPSFTVDNEDIEPPQGIRELLDKSPLHEQFLYEGSDEGGRFFQYINQYDVRWLHADVEASLPDNLAWFTLGQLRALLRESDLLSDETRSILSLLLSSAYCGQCPQVQSFEHHRSA